MSVVKTRENRRMCGQVLRLLVVGAVLISFGGCYKPTTKDLFEAVKKSNVKDAKYFLKQKDSNIEAKDEKGNTALVYAVRGDRKEMIELLISKGADSKITNEDGKTLLHFAAGDNLPQALECLLSKGLDANAKNKDGRTPLDYAVRNKQNTLIDILKKHGGIEGNPFPMPKQQPAKQAPKPNPQPAEAVQQPAPAAVQPATGADIEPQSQVPAE